MSTDTLAEHFRERLGERVLDTQLAYEQLTVTVIPEAFAQVARFCKDELDMTFFDFLAGVDEREDGFSAVARVYSHTTREGVLLKVLAPGGRDQPRLPTLTGVYAGADWHEREAYDMFGIVFDGHPGLLPRILTVENFEGWPLRKDFRLASRDVKPWPGAKEPGGSDEEEGTQAPASPAPGADPQDRAAAAKAKAERAKAKAAEARKRKAAERAAAEDTTGPEAAAGGSGGHPQEGTAASTDVSEEEKEEHDDE
ncbi:MAG TPA: NADH-quinone oxidoreductase subunit C [Euzebya sp.]|nr:NADH-quinone oxidoreductase subunit C [Euzebya sp.]